MGHFMHVKYECLELSNQRRVLVKNLKIGPKIILGFSLVFFLLLLIAMTAVSTSVLTGSNIGEVDVYSGLQSNANEL